MHITSLGAAREIQEGIAVDPLLVGCGVKPHDLDLSRPLGRNQYSIVLNSTNIRQRVEAPRR
ncbi:MAG: hypothetical protein DI594_04060 [Shewanella oneidensis]|nr:MAG: hypothetical protein DI594_04060 [Shewanella oneidensis]